MQAEPVDPHCRRWISRLHPYRDRTPSEATDFEARASGGLLPVSTRSWATFRSLRFKCS